MEKDNLTLAHILKEVIAEDRSILGRRDDLLNKLTPLVPGEQQRYYQPLKRAIQEFNVAETMLMADEGTDEEREAVKQTVLKVQLEANVQEKRAQGVVDTFVEAMGWDEKLQIAAVEIEQSKEKNEIEPSEIGKDNSENKSQEKEILSTEKKAHKKKKIGNTSAKENNSWICPICGNAKNNGAFCVQCGYGVSMSTSKIQETQTSARSLPQYMRKFCLKCGKPIENGAQYCTECGTPVETEFDRHNNDVLKPYSTDNQPDRLSVLPADKAGNDLSHQTSVPRNDMMIKQPQSIYSNSMQSQEVDQYYGLGKPARRKSMAVAMILSILFGPVGMLYANVKHALILIVLDIIGCAATGGALSVLFWIVSIIWTYSDVKTHNEGIAS